MQTRIYHWKHGWIPLDHSAAMSKSKGSHAGAARYLEKSHAAGHAHASVVGGSYGGGTHVRGMQPVAAEHLPRERHITAAYSPETRRFALHDGRGSRVGLSSQHDGVAVTTSIPEHLAEHLHARGHRIQAVKKNADGGHSVLVETKDGKLKQFKADGTDKHTVDPLIVEPPKHAPAEHTASTDHRDQYQETHTVRPAHSPGRAVVVPVGGRGRGVDIIDGKVGEHINANGHKVIGYSRKVITTVDEHGIVRRFKANGDNLDKPVIVKSPSTFKRNDLAGWTHVPAHHAILDDGSAGGAISAANVQRAYVNGNKRVLIESKVTDNQAEAFLHNVNTAFDLTKGSTDHAITIHVKSGDPHFRSGRRGMALGYVYSGDTTRVHINPKHLTGDVGTDRPGFKMDAVAPKALYTLVHELGHITDFKNNHTQERSAYGRIIRPAENQFHRDNLHNLSDYGRTKVVEGYAEAFAQHHLSKWDHPLVRYGAKSRPEHTQAAANYAARYGW